MSTQIDHQAKAISRLITEYRESTNLIDYIEAFTAESNELEVVFQDFLDDRWVDTSVGVQLDIIGVIVGQERVIPAFEAIPFFGFLGVIGAGTFGSLITTLSITAEDTVPRGLFFKPDGLKMYVIGDTNNSVYEYDLSIAWDATTAVYLQLFPVVTEDTSPQGIFFKPDGLKMYTVGDQNDSVYEYDLSVAWDISTATHLQTSSVAAKDNSLSGIFFKSDGLKMYVVGEQNDSVYEYDLSVNWDISTAVYLQTLSVTAKDTSPMGIFFKPDGLKMYVVGNQNDSMYEYDLSVAWDISTSTYSKTLSVATEDTSPMGVFFKSDGLKMYVVGNQNDSVYGYNFSIAWDIEDYSELFKTLTDQEFTAGTLDDTTYRTYIKAKILKNITDTTINSIISVVELIIPSTLITITESSAAFDINIDAVLTDTEKLILTRGDIVPRPAGVAITFQDQIGAFA